MVKDEADTILETLESCKGSFQSLYVSDTGSTDGTQEVIREWARENLGEEYHQEWAIEETSWVNFAHNRNHTLDGAARHFPDSWLLMVDAGCVLRGKIEVPEIDHVDGPPGRIAGCYAIQVKLGNLSYPQTRMFHTSELAQWRFRGVVHEQPVGPYVPHTLEGPVLDYCLKDDKRAKRWERDLVLLEDGLKEEPSNTRYQFYLAQTLDCLGRKEEACKAYIHRGRNPEGYVEERYESLIRAGRLLCEKQLFLEAIALFPDRAEGYYHYARTLGNLAFKTKKRELWYEIRLWAKAAVARIQRDKRLRKGLFVVDDIHEYLAEETLAHAKLMIGSPEEKEEGRRTLKRLLPRIPEDKRAAVSDFIDRMG
jgi:glycosyltransferase involved in cell wall biosynthesis